ncbi:hypothetical protein KJ632_03540 [Patescibacteria group bacterium]|nr:hypothetical protein [Patescibacteria group bacterium]
METIQRTEKGFLIPASLEIQNPEPLIDLIRLQYSKLAIELIDSDIPDNNFPEGLLWERNDIGPDKEEPYFIDTLMRDFSHRPIDKYIIDLWNKLGKKDLVHTSISPIYIDPWQYKDDLRDGWMRENIAFAVTYIISIAVGGTLGNNVIELKKGFEVESIIAAIDTATRFCRCVDLRGIEWNFQDDLDDQMIQQLGSAGTRERILDVDGLLRKKLPLPQNLPTLTEK